MAKTALEVFEDDSLSERLDNAALYILRQFNGRPAIQAQAIVFNVWLALAALNETDPGVDFERLLASFEARKMATHRNNGSVN